MAPACGISINCHWTVGGGGQCISASMVVSRRVYIDWVGRACNRTEEERPRTSCSAKRRPSCGATPTGGAGCPCTIRLTVLNETSSEAHKFKLVALMSGFYTGTIVGDAVTWAANFGIM